MPTACMCTSHSQITRILNCGRRRQLREDANLRAVEWLRSGSMLGINRLCRKRKMRGANRFLHPPVLCGSEVVYCTCHFAACVFLICVYLRSSAANVAFLRVSVPRS